MAEPSASPAPKRFTFTTWLIVSIAAIGFAFDIYELLMLPLVLRPALEELIHAQPGTADFALWAGRLFYIPAFAGGIFGLFGGYLTDRLGRRRVLTWSILLYAVSAFLAGFSTNVWMLLILRSTTFIGVCVEFVAAVAWLAELFPDPEQREKVLGYTQAFSSIGGLLVAVANGIAIAIGPDLPAIIMPEFFTSWLGEILSIHQHEAWRYTLMSGLIPAIPLIVIRPFLPESPVWAKKHAEGTLRRPSIMALFAPEHRRTTIVTTIMFACSYGVAFGAIQQIPLIVRGLGDLQERTKGLPQAQQSRMAQELGSDYTKVQEIGGLIGRFLLAILAVRIVSRRRLLRVFQVPALFVVPLVFYFFLSIPNYELFTIDLKSIKIGRFPITTVSLLVLLAGLFTVAQFSFWGNYLPRVYPVHLRGTGESFAANIGGRMIGTSFAWVTQELALQSFMPGQSGPMKLTMTAAVVAFSVTLIGSIACFFLPEPKPEMEE